MSTNYPAQIDTTQSLPTVIDNFTPVQGKIFNQLRDAVIAIESALGTSPQGLYTNVASRINTLENVVGNLQIIELAQDLGGTLASPLVIGLQGHPVSDGYPAVNYVLTWDGIAWVPLPPKGLIDVTLGCDLAGTKTCQFVVGLQGNPLSSVTPTNGDLLQWNGLEWIPGAPPPSASANNSLPFVAGAFTTNSNTPVRFGGREIDMSAYPAMLTNLSRTVEFIAAIEVTTSSATCQVQLVDTTHDVVISNTIGTTSNFSGLFIFNSGPLAVGTSAGNIRTDAITTYEVQVSMLTGNVSSDRAICTNARVDITYA